MFGPLPKRTGKSPASITSILCPLLRAKNSESCTERVGHGHPKEDVVLAGVAANNGFAVQGNENQPNTQADDNAITNDGS